MVILAVTDYLVMLGGLLPFATEIPSQLLHTGSACDSAKTGYQVGSYFKLLQYQLTPERTAS